MEELGSLAPAVDASALEPTRGRRPAEPDAQLLDRLRRRDHLAFDALVASYGGHVLALATHFDPPTAADVTQEVFLRVWLRIADYQGRARFSTWLYRIVRNAAADARRARRRRREEPLAAFALHLQAAAAAPSGAEGRIDLERALAELSPRLRWPIVLRFVAGLEYDEIALALECPVGTVSSRLRRGLRQLEGHLRSGSHRQSERNAGRRRVAQIAVGAGLVALTGALVLSLLRVPPRIEERAGPLTAFENAALSARQSSRELELVSADPRAIRDWLRLHGGYSADLVLDRPTGDGPRGPNIELLGAPRATESPGAARTASVFARVDGLPVTLLVGHGEDVDGVPEWDFRGKRLLVRRDPTSGARLISWKNAGKAYSLVTDTTQPAPLACQLCHTDPSRIRQIERWAGGL